MEDAAEGNLHTVEVKIGLGAPYDTRAPVLLQILVDRLADEGSSAADELQDYLATRLFPKLQEKSISNQWNSWSNQHKVRAGGGRAREAHANTDRQEREAAEACRMLRRGEERRGEERRGEERRGEERRGEERRGEERRGEERRGEERRGG
ncbi:hypothetical protein Q8A73_013899 [Channa argus]|nr:hypothetical protein Q8A73_013899 [Channa argus]